MFTDSRLLESKSDTRGRLVQGDHHGYGAGSTGAEVTDIGWGGCVRPGKHRHPACLADNTRSRIQNSQTHGGK